MDELDYREIIYRLEKVLEKKTWSNEVKDNLRKMIDLLWEKNEDFVETICDENKISKKKYISDILTALEKEIYDIKFFTKGPISILGENRVLGLNIKENGRSRIYSVLDDKDTPEILQHEIGHRKIHKNILGIRLGEENLSVALNEAIAIESENKINDIQKELEINDLFVYYTINRQLYNMIGTMLYDDNEKDLVGSSIDMLENKYSMGKQMQAYWQNFIAIMMKIKKENIDKMKECQKALFNVKLKEETKDKLESLYAKASDKQDIDMILMIRNLEDKITTINYISDNKLDFNQFTEFNKGVEKAYSAGVRKNFMKLNHLFFDIMYAQIEQLETVEDIYNRIAIIKKIEPMCQIFENVTNKKGKIQQFYEKVNEKKEKLIKEGKITRLVRCDEER